MRIFSANETDVSISQNKKFLYDNKKSDIDDLINIYLKIIKMLTLIKQKDTLEKCIYP